MIGRDDPAAYRVPALPLMAALRDGRVLAFLAVWFGLNVVFGTGAVSIDASEQQVAWQAHIGGFLVGLLAFALFDPVKSAPAAGSNDEATTH
jgi:membrane associated rhomboid family serine protease